MSDAKRKKPKGEPRWPAIAAVVAAGALNLTLPAWVTAGPRGLLLAIVTLLALPVQVAHMTGRPKLNHALSFVSVSILTVGLLCSLSYLLAGMSTHKLQPTELLLCAGALWLSNVMVFSLWYWRLDAGGPNRRDAREGHSDGAFLFPQMTLESRRDGWSPGFVDYLFLAFNTSTALSPTDAPVLDRWAKLLMMTQSLISLTIVALLVARAINTLA